MILKLIGSLLFSSVLAGSSEVCAVAEIQQFAVSLDQTVVTANHAFLRV